MNEARHPVRCHRRPRTDQACFWRNESWNYFERNYKGTDLRSLPLSPYLERLFDAWPVEIVDGSILEIGCGAANNLHHLRRRFEVRRAVGTEPSLKVVHALRNTFPELEFQENYGDGLPFDSDEFDLVVLRSVLHWVDRNHVLQTIGEAIRVTRSFLVISDFAPQRPYSAPYHHVPQYRTFKMNYQPLVEASGIMRCVANISSDDLDPWNVVQTALYRKIPLEEAFPMRQREDFARAE